MKLIASYHLCLLFLLLITCCIGSEAENQANDVIQNSNKVTTPNSEENEIYEEDKNEARIPKESVTIPNEPIPPTASPNPEGDRVNEGQPKMTQPAEAEIQKDDYSLEDSHPKPRENGKADDIEAKSSSEAELVEDAEEYGSTEQDDLQPLSEKSQRGSQEISFHLGDFSASHVFTFILGGKSEECFYNDYKLVNSLFRSAFFVSSGGNLKVDFRILVNSDSDSKTELVDIRSKSEYVSSFLAKSKGTYSFCVMNNERAEKQVTIALNLDANDSHKSRNHQVSLKKEHIHSLKQTVMEARQILEGLESEQEFLTRRTTGHLQTQDSTEWRVAYYTLMEAVFMGVVALAQIVFIQRLVK